MRVVWGKYYFLIFIKKEIIFLFEGEILEAEKNNYYLFYHISTKNAINIEAVKYYL